MKSDNPEGSSVDKKGEGETKAPSSLEEGVGGGGVSPDTLRRRATELRNNPTEPELRLWSALRRSQLLGHKFRRQQVIGRRIVDFFCSGAKLAVEVDGDTHDYDRDVTKDRILLIDHGIETVRFTNEQVMRNLEGVLERLSEILRSMNHPPTPSFEKEGEI